MKNNRPAQYRPQDNRPSSLVHRPSSGFTLTELLLALMVAAIVLAAAATMADAMSCGKRETENMTRTATYLAQLHTRLADLVMRAESIEELPEGENKGVEIVCAEGKYKIYTDASQNILYVKDFSKPEPNTSEYDYKIEDATTQNSVSVQKNVHIQYENNHVTITFDINDARYTLTATPRGER